uniref:Zinc finger, CCHC-type n=1 Tax=Tanacetum cinerariifolium TaxID=118510 RepID=A0A6L2JV56_TANCI|nr:zinc finger, CCHC-type [Tanacetum cinerariifolium]
MAELVIYALLPVVFEKLASVLENKIARAKGIHSELKKWERKLPLIQALLEDASQKEVKSKAVKNWLNDLQHLAYDIDDVLDALATDAMHREPHGEASFKKCDGLPLALKALGSLLRTKTNEEEWKRLLDDEICVGLIPICWKIKAVIKRYDKKNRDTSKKEVSTTSTPQFRCSMLKPSNYSLWAIRMQIILEVNGLWEMIEPLETTKADNKKNKTAIAFLYQVLPEEQLLQITKHKTAKAIWDALKTRHIGEERVQQARLQTLKSDFEMLHMKEDETIDTFTGKLTTLVNKAANLGHTIEDQTLVRKLLNVVPDRYLQIVASIEQYSGLSEMTMEEAIERLKTYEERIKYKKGKQVDNQEKLMFTRHESKGKYFRGRRRGKHRFSQGKSHEKFKEERKDGEYSHRSFNRNNFKKTSYDTSKLQCYQCKKIWHIAPNCPQRTKANEQSNLVEEELEPTLLMTILEESDERNQVKKVEEQKVSLHEEDVGYKETNIDSLWYLDNGASNHMAGVREHFKELDENVSGKIRFGDGSYIEIKGKGSILIECDDEKQRIISHVYYIPSLKSNLLSLGQFTKIGCKVVMEDDELRLYDMDNKIFMKVTRQRNRLYKSNLRIGTPICLLANLKDDTWLWHARLGHLNFESLKSMAQRDLVHGIPTIKHKTQVCDVCLIGKHSRAPFPKKAKARSTSPLDLVYGDLCGPITPPTPSGKRYIFLLVDDYSRYMWVYFLSTKDQAFDTFKEYKKKIENKLRTTLKMLRTDRGGEFTSSEFTQYCKENGIARQLTAPYSSQQNRVVERRNRTIIGVKFKENEIWDWKEYMSEHINDEPEWIDFKIGNLEVTSEHHNQGTQPIEEDNEFLKNDDDGYVSPTTDSFSHSQTPHTPSTSTSQIEAMKVELDSINKNNTWELTTLPKGHKAIGLKWVFKTKKDANGNIIKHKARLVAKGYIQEHGIDFEEVFAPIARMETIRLLLAIAANNKWENYTKISRDSTIIVGVYVDDIIITGTPKKEIDKFKAQMEEKFEMSDLGLLAYYLGIEVTQTSGDISIKQTAYANKILNEAGMIDCNETLISMDPGTRLTKITEGIMVNSTEYQSLIGCLRYLLHTRPDLSCYVGLLSRFMQEPVEQHMKAIRQVLCYVKRTKDYGITYKHNGGDKIHGFSDSSYRVNTQEGKRTTGIIFYYGESPIGWSTKKQATVALSSCESESIAATQALWLKRLLSKLTHSARRKDYNTG